MLSSKVIIASISFFVMLGNCVFARPPPSEVSYDKIITSNNTHREEKTEEQTLLADMTLIKRAPSSNCSNSGFSWKNLLPSHFGELFEIFVFFMELKWHYEIEHVIAAVGDRISDDLHKSMVDTETPEMDGGGIEINEVDKSFARAKYLQFYLNAMASLYAGHGTKSELSKI